MRTPSSFHKFLMISLTLCGLWQSVAAQVGNRLSPDLKSTMDSLIRLEMSRQHIVGMSVALVSRGDLVYASGYGFADRETRLPADENTFYRLASLSKTITSTAVLHAVQNGQMNLKADVRQYVPEFPDKGMGPLTIEQLLACEAGLQHYDQTAAFNREALTNYIIAHPDRYDPIAALDIFKDQPLFSAPGMRFNYSTFSFNLLAAALERATGMPYVDYVREHIGLRAGLPYLQPEFSARRPYPQQSAWYRVEGGESVLDTGSTYDYADISWKLGGGGYTGTVLDAAGFAQALFNGTYLNAENLNRMFTMRRINGKPTYYGMGVFLNKRNGLVYGSQFGNQVGARSMLYMSPDSSNAIILLSNTYGTDLLPLAKQLMDQIQYSRMLDTLWYPMMLADLAKTSWASAPAENLVPAHPGYLFWDLVPGAEGYELEWSEYPDFSHSNRQILGRKTSFQLPEWSRGKVYFCRIRALNDYRLLPQYGSWSDVLELSKGLAGLP